MKKITGMNGIYSRKWRVTWTVLILVFSLISVSAAYSVKDPWVASIEKNGDNVLFADHNESLTEGGWILLSGGKEIQLPQPFTFTYCGTDNLKSKGINLELKSGAQENNTELTFTYPYCTHPFYTVNQNVKMDYKGPAVFGQQKVNVYLIKGLGISSFGKAVKEITDEKNLSLNYTVTSATLDKNGDLSAPLQFKSLPAGHYGIVMTLAENESTKPAGIEKKVLSATGFEVLEYDLQTKVANTLEEGKDLEVNLDLKKNTEPENSKYGAVLISKDAYRALIEVNSNGTRKGTEICVNGIDIIEDFGINSTNFESKLDKDELTKEIQTVIGECNGTITIGEKGQSTLSLTTFDLPAGDYFLFTGAYEKGKGITGVDQTELSICAATDSSQPIDSDSSLSDTRPVEDKASTLEESSNLKTANAAGIVDAGSIAGKVADIVKNPPKATSFLVGFAGTLAAGMVLMRIKK
ncbi:MAG: TIGR04279 domain-containing protein [Methanosarcina barkeri]|nr:TIGR04279 domain-containing protein [Methanosarcina sp. ERenArc_MAG2]